MCSFWILTHDVNLCLPRVFRPSASPEMKRDVAPQTRTADVRVREREQAEVEEHEEDEEELEEDEEDEEENEDEEDEEEEDAFELEDDEDEDYTTKQLKSLGTPVSRPSFDRGHGR